MTWLNKIFAKISTQNINYNWEAYYCCFLFFFLTVNPILMIFGPTLYGTYVSVNLIPEFNATIAAIGASNETMSNALSGKRLTAQFFAWETVVSGGVLKRVFGEEIREQKLVLAFFILDAIVKAGHFFVG